MRLCEAFEADICAVPDKTVRHLGNAMKCWYLQSIAMFCLDSTKSGVLTNTAQWMCLTGMLLLSLGCEIMTVT